MKTIITFKDGQQLALLHEEELTEEEIQVMSSLTVTEFLLEYALAKTEEAKKAKNK